MLDIVQLFILRWKCCIDDLSDWESIFAKMWSQHLPTMIAKGSYMLFKKNKNKKKNKRFSPCAKQLMIASACCLSKLLSSYLLLKLDSAKRDGRLMSWSAAILTESKVSEFCGCLKYIFQRVGLRTENEIPLFRNWFPSVTWDVICIKKFSISFLSQYEIYTDFAHRS